MLMRHLARGLFCLGVLHAVPAAASGTTTGDQNDRCTMDIVQGANIQWRGLRGRGYEIFDPTRTYEVFELALRHTGNACRFYVTLAPAGGSATLTGSNGGTLDFDVVGAPDGRSLLSQTYGGTETSRIGGESGAGSWDTALPLYLVIPPAQLARAGDYQGGAIVRLFVIDKRGLASLASETTASFLAHVPGQVQTRLDGLPGGSTLSVDFGDLRLSPSRSLDLHLATNANVAVFLSSANRGRLMHQSGEVGVPYTVRIGNTDLSLTGSTSLPLASAGSGQDTFMPMTLAVGKVAGTLVAGHYGDTLTVTITPQ